MSEAFIGELRLMSFNFAPRGWAQCNGQLLPINQNQALFSLLGTQYGGNGINNFALPDLRSRTPLHPGDGITQGDRGGQESVALSLPQLPSHSHAVMASTDIANTSAPGGALPAARPRGGLTRYGNGNDTILNPSALTQAGAGQPHSNLQPYLVLNWAIALQGIFPSRN